MAKRSKKAAVVLPPELGYDELLTGISELLERARRMSARSVNSILTTTYWEIGRRIVEFEQGGKARAEYGVGLWKRLAADLTAKYGRGFSKSNLASMRSFYLGWEIFQTPSGKSEARVRFVESNTSVGEILQTPSGESPDPDQSPIASAKSPLSLVVRQPSETPTTAYPGVFPLAWSHYVQLMSVTTARARAFYEAEAMRGGWSVRQLDRQISTQFYERTSHSKRQAAMLAKGQIAKPEDAMTVEDEVRDARGRRRALSVSLWCVRRAVGEHLLLKGSWPTAWSLGDDLQVGGCRVDGHQLQRHGGRSGSRKVLTQQHQAFSQLLDQPPRSILLPWDLVDTDHGKRVMTLNNHLQALAFFC